jgi:hypothetical protein
MEPRNSNEALFSLIAVSESGRSANHSFDLIVSDSMRLRVEGRFEASCRPCHGSQYQSVDLNVAGQSIPKRKHPIDLCPEV